MDPKICLKMMADALARNDKWSWRVWSDDLYNWLDRGGFAPDWGAHPDAAARFSHEWGVDTGRRF